MATNRKRPRKRASPKTRHGFPPAPAPERASSPRGVPFPRGNKLGLPTQFKPGQTGNPGGVPKDLREFRELYRARALMALSRIDDMLEHGSEEGVIKAIREVNANAWPRSLEVTGADGGPVRITYDDVRLKLNDLAQKALEKREAEQAAADGDDGTGDDPTDAE